MQFVLTIPKGTDIMEFLQELDGEEGLTKDAWYFMHRNVVEKLMEQSKASHLAPALALADGNISFSLHYNQQHVGVIALRTMPCKDSQNHPLWFVVSDMYLSETSPIQIAFRRLSPVPNESIFLELEKTENI